MVPSFSLKPSETDSIKFRSHQRHLVGKRTAQKDTTTDITSDVRSGLMTVVTTIVCETEPLCLIGMRLKMLILILMPEMLLIILKKFRNNVFLIKLFE